MNDFLVVNGKKISSNSANISPFDAGFTYGFSIYETFFIKDSKVSFFAEHIERMMRSVSYLKIGVGHNFCEIIKSQAKDLIVSNKLISGRMRLTISPGIWALPNFDSEKITTILTTSPISQVSKSIRLLTSEFRKTNEAFLPSFVKVTGNFPSILSYKEAREKGFDEAVMLRRDDVITEGSFCNLFWIDRLGKIKTPSLNSCILDGVTRNQIIESAKSIGVKIDEGEFKSQELESCDSLFISSSTRGLLQASQLDDRIFVPTKSEEIKAIQKEYERLENESLNLF